MRDVDSVDDSEGKATIGSFRLGHELGSSTWGDEWSVRRVEGDDEAFMIVVPPRDDSETSALLLEALSDVRAAHAGASLRHPNILTLIEAGVDNGRPFLVYESFAGCGLDALIAAWVERAEVEDDHDERIAELFVEIGVALQHGHELGITHGDVRAENIIVDGQRVRVRGYGLASVVDDVRGLRRERLGACAPELIEDEERDADEASDLYSLGVMMYEALTLRAPYAANGREALRRAILRGDAATAATLEPWIPKPLSRIVAQAMSCRAEERYASIEAFVADLYRFLDGEPVSARAPSPTKEALGWAMDHPRVVLGSVAGALVLTLAGAWMTSDDDNGAGSAELVRRVTDNTPEVATGELDEELPPRALPVVEPAAPAPAPAPVEVAVVPTNDAPLATPEIETEPEQLAYDEPELSADSGETVIATEQTAHVLETTPVLVTTPVALESKPVVEKPNVVDAAWSDEIIDPEDLVAVADPVAEQVAPVVEKEPRVEPIELARADDENDAVAVLDSELDSESESEPAMEVAASSEEATTPTLDPTLAEVAEVAEFTDGTDETLVVDAQDIASDIPNSPWETEPAIAEVTEDVVAPGSDTESVSEVVTESEPIFAASDEGDDDAWDDDGWGDDPWGDDPWDDAPADETPTAVDAVAVAEPTPEPPVIEEAPRPLTRAERSSHLMAAATVLRGAHLDRDPSATGVVVESVFSPRRTLASIDPWSRISDPVVTQALPELGDAARQAAARLTDGLEIPARAGRIENTDWEAAFEAAIVVGAVPPTVVTVADLPDVEIVGPWLEARAALAVLDGAYLPDMWIVPDLYLRVGRVEDADVLCDHLFAAELPEGDEQLEHARLTWAMVRLSPGSSPGGASEARSIIHAALASELPSLAARAAHVMASRSLLRGELDAARMYFAMVEEHAGVSPTIWSWKADAQRISRSLSPMTDDGKVALLDDIFDDPAERLLRAVRWLDAGCDGAARTVFERVVAENPSSSKDAKLAGRLRCVSLLAARRPLDARVALDDMLDRGAVLSPDAVYVMARVGIALHRSGHDAYDVLTPVEDRLVQWYGEHSADAQFVRMMLDGRDPFAPPVPAVAAPFVSSDSAAPSTPSVFDTFLQTSEPMASAKTGDRHSSESEQVDAAQPEVVTKPEPPKYIPPESDLRFPKRDG